MRKPVFAICEQERRSLISAFVFRCLDSSNTRNFKALASFCGCAGRFVSPLVANPEDRVSRDKTHM